MLYKYVCILFFVVLLLMTKYCQAKDDDDYYIKEKVPYSWITSFKLFRNNIKECLLKYESIQSKKTTWGSCLTTETLKLFDDIMSSNVITLLDGVKLVKISSGGENVSEKHQNKSIKHKKATEMRFSTKKNNERINDFERNSYKPVTWFEHICNRITETLSTHVLQINMTVLEERDNIERISVSGRHRRHRNNMMMAMMFGVTAMGAIIVPIGFQLLSVVTGKALLLAKMALLLASINGLKRIASSGIHYGLYHVPDGGGYYDRAEREPIHAQPFQQTKPFLNYQ